MKHEELVYELAELRDKAPRIFGIPTGTKLDEMFYTVQYDEKKDTYVKKPLGGIPHLAVINVTGIPDTGKSLLAEQFAVYQAARNYPVLFVTVESPANFLYSALKQKAQVLGLDFESLERNMIIIDASQNVELREDVGVLLDTMAYAIKKKNTKNVVIDSITGLYEHREVLARQIVRQIFNFLKKWNQTALLVSQKRSSQSSETAEAAGGLAVAHIVDGTIVMDKEVIMSKWAASLYKRKIGEVVRTIRIDGCRLVPHASETYLFEITDTGLIDIKEPLGKVAGGD
ncbi:KaiC domain protein, AF_0795 family [Aciduliprofundum sp. MAR08-339]|uniref:KaiC domain-containing protein n=1 Tax=Aciduliprofundum sp. (strain MAR08-339) TaxID=673860 RepID=UPI0002A4B7F3|nr:KaiC domain protein, AF_0795 family [Aciduliprofundum sp. MAR08-339]